MHTECCQNRAAYTVGYAVFPSSIYRDTGPYLGKCEALEWTLGSTDEVLGWFTVFQTDA